MDNAQNFVADKSDERLDVFLARQFPEYSRAFWQKICDAKEVIVNNKIAKASQKMQVGDKIVVNRSQKPQVAPLDLPIIYEDDDVIVINKPAGMLTHAKGAVSDEFTVGEFMRAHTTDGIGTNRPGIVHRLDRGTSGVIIAAKNPEAKVWLQKQFANRKVKKTYLALVEGHPTDNEAILNLPIERNPKKPQTFRVGANGKPAETFYSTDAKYQNYSLLRLQPHTGRTHQLRVHTNYIGHSIAGDELYGKANAKLGRLFLHAAELEITLPSRERKTFVAPLPKELEIFLKNLK